MRVQLILVLMNFLTVGFFAIINGSNPGKIKLVHPVNPLSEVLTAENEHSVCFKCRVR